MVGTSHAPNPPKAKKPIAKRRATALVRLSVPRDIFVTSGSSRYMRITAMATGIRIGWRKLMIFAPAQITAQRTTTRRSTKQAVSAAHIILRCQGVGYSFMLHFQRPTSNGRYVGFVFTGKSLLIVFLVLSILSVSVLFFGSSASAFCQASSAYGPLFNFR